MFDDYRTSRFFAKIILNLDDKLVKKFSDEVKKLYDTKSVSEKELSTYKITSSDLESILKKINK